MLKTYEYRLYPTEAQEVLLNKHFGAVRYVYNWGLDLKKTAWEQHGESISDFDLCKLLTVHKNLEDKEWLYEISNPALQYAIKNLGRAYTNFFKKRSDFPKFKSKRSCRDSFSTAIGNKINFDTHRVQILKFKEGIKYRGDLRFEGKIKTCTVKRTKAGKYFVSVLVDDGKDLPKKPETVGKVVGIDLGVREYLVTSEGGRRENPGFGEKSKRKLARAQRKLSKRKPGSKNREKQRIRVAKIHEKTANQRKDFIFKLARKVIDENQDSLIAIENLDIQSMLVKGNVNLARSISDAGWGELVRVLKYKADWEGFHLHQIGRYEPSSKTCSECEHVFHELGGEKSWKCPGCGVLHDRDTNAAKNIRKMAIKEIGMGSPEFTLVETSKGSRKQESELETIECDYQKSPVGK